MARSWSAWIQPSSPLAVTNTGRAIDAALATPSVDLSRVARVDPTMSLNSPVASTRLGF
jgi:hypothetical protein